MPRRRRHKKAETTSPEQEAEAKAGGECYVVERSATLGRYLVARQDLPEGTVVISEDPLVVGPVSDSPPICLGCYTELPDIDAAEKCKTCKWPLCSNDCKGLNKTNGHSREECLQLSKCPVTSNSLPKQQWYNAVFPLRCLLLKEHQPEKWNVLKTMVAHNDIRRRRGSIWEYNQHSIVDRIRKEWNIDKFSELEIHSVCGYTEVNAFSIGCDTVNIQGLYPTAFLASHDCVANTSHTDDEDFHIHVFTSAKVPKGEVITLAYTNSLLGTMKRREHLRRCKFFECACGRCSDPTELGTYMSAIRCRNCNSGRVLSTDPLKDDADWCCDEKSCNRLHPVQDIHNVINRIEAEINSLKQERVEVLEAAICRYSKLLHPSHYLVIRLKYSLSHLYGKSAGHLISQMSETALERKIQICEDILKTFDIIEPGFTRIRGITMYELHAPLMILTIRRSEKQTISKVELTKNLKRVAFYLRECSRLLKFEPKSSEQAAIRAAAAEGLEHLRSWEPVVGKL